MTVKASEKAGTGRDVITVFSVLWALAAIFHLLNSDDAAAFITSPRPASMVHALVGIAALWILVHPTDLRALGALAIFTPISAWVEAPMLGNHWLLAALIDLGLLGTMVATRHGRRIDRERLADLFVPVACATLVVFYAFAAFSKLNSAFINPAVSCATFFATEVPRSFGIPASWLGWMHSNGFLAALAPWFTIAIEASIPALLLVRRTRHVGVVVGLGFHAAIALDLSHNFADFSSVLSAVFILFLPRSFATGIVERCSRLSATLMSVLSLVAVGVALVLLLSLWIDNGLWTTLVMDARMPAWFIVDAALLAVVGAFLVRDRTAPERRFSELAKRKWLAIVPTIALLNGLTPYLELKTGFAWNMYSNLSTADGVSNHLLLPNTAHLTAYQDHPVRIVHSSDGDMEVYAVRDFLLPMLQLRAYTSQHPSASLTYVVDGQTHRDARVGDDVNLSRPPSSLETHVLSFRAIDDGTPARCQPAFLPLN